MNRFCWGPPKALILSLSSIVVLLCLGTATAVVLRPLSDQELVSRSTHVSFSVVTNIESFWHHKRILSWVTLKTRTSFRGHSDEVRILIPGGSVGNISQRVPGGPMFEVGQEQLFFLEALPKSDGYRLVGFTQGAVEPTQTSKVQRLLAYLGASVPATAPDLRERIR